MIQWLSFYSESFRKSLLLKLTTVKFVLVKVHMSSNIMKMSFTAVGFLGNV